MKVNVNAGHTKSGLGYGAAYGGYKESAIVRLVATEVIRLLKQKGHTVTDSTVDSAPTQGDYLKSVVRKANASSADLFISIHCNASATHQGHGVEVYTWKGRKHDVGVRLCYEISKLGFRNRGVKNGDHLYVIQNTTMEAVLIELFFLDNATDQNLYTKVGYRSIAKAIVEAI